MTGIDEILRSGRFPGFIISDGKTEQRKCEDESAKRLLAGCRELEERHGSNFMRGSGMPSRIVKEVWDAELADTRRNSITERYDDRMARIEETAEKTGLE